MTKQIYMLILLGCLINLPAAVSSMADEVQDESPRNCITTRRVTSSIIVNDLNILFLMPGKTAYLNILPKQCKGLSRYGRFIYRTTAGSLCNLDTIQVVLSNGYPGRSCVLGSFHPVNKEDALAMMEEPREPPAPKSLSPAEVEDIIEESDEPSDP
jgi:hypothetical protein